MQQQLLLLQDVPKLGRKGEIVKAKPGYIRNYLLPQQKAVIANKGTLRMREQLQKERAKQAEVDRVESEKLSKVIEGKVLKTEVKVDMQGNLYGSVSVIDIVKILDKEGITVERHHVALPRPIKKVGKHKIDLILSEGVPTHFFLEVEPEAGMFVKQAAPTAPAVEETPAAE